jgi:hypothetical protein
VAPLLATRTAAQAVTVDHDAPAASSRLQGKLLHNFPKKKPRPKGKKKKEGRRRRGKGKEKERERKGKGKERKGKGKERERKGKGKERKGKGKERERKGCKTDCKTVDTNEHLLIIGGVHKGIEA